MIDADQIPSPSPDDPSRLARITATTARKLQASFDEIREAYTHSGLKGASGEELVAEFLRQRLPSSIGVTTGQVLDTDGGMSKQVDVVLYDALRTPMLFASSVGASHLVPAEGVLGVIEVKTHLTSTLVEGCIANCQSVKQRIRRAYFTQAIQQRHSAYGSTWDELPIFYSVFAATSDGMYAGKLNELQAAIPVHERIDSVGYLDRGINLNVRLAGTPVPKPQFAARPDPTSAVTDCPSEHALLLWYATLAGAVMQAGVRPIDISRYLASELEVTGKLPSGPQNKALYDQVLEALIVGTMGLSPDLLQRFRDQALTQRDRYDILRSPMPTSIRGAGMGPTATPEDIAAARALSFEEWSSKVDQLDT